MSLVSYLQGCNCSEWPAYVASWKCMVFYEPLCVKVPECGFTAAIRLGACGWQEQHCQILCVNKYARFAMAALQTFVGRSSMVIVCVIIGMQGNCNGGFAKASGEAGVIGAAAAEKGADCACGAERPAKGLLSRHPHSQHARPCRRTLFR